MPAGRPDSHFYVAHPRRMNRRRVPPFACHRRTHAAGIPPRPLGQTKGWRRRCGFAGLTEGLPLPPTLWRDPLNFEPLRVDASPERGLREPVLGQRGFINSNSSSGIFVYVRAWAGYSFLLRRRANMP